MLQALIFSLIAFIKFKLLLKKCLVTQNINNVTLFEYKGKTYDRNKFVDLKAGSLYEADLKKKHLEKELARLQSSLATSKTPDLDAALIDAYKIVIERTV